MQLGQTPHAIFEIRVYPRFVRTLTIRGSSLCGNPPDSSGAHPLGMPVADWVYPPGMLRFASFAQPVNMSLNTSVSSFRHFIVFLMSEARISQMANHELRKCLLLFHGRRAKSIHCDHFWRVCKTAEGGRDAAVLTLPSGAQIMHMLFLVLVSKKEENECSAGQYILNE